MTIILSAELDFLELIKIYYNIKSRLKEGNWVKRKVDVGGFIDNVEDFE